jgi:hypothetical protein
LGYSNYVSQRNATQKKPIDLSLLKGNITPGGVKQLVGGAMDVKNQEVETYQTMADKTDAAAAGIAADKLAEMKVARAKADIEAKLLKENLQYKPTNWAESEIVNYMKNPYNQDGTLKTRDQLKEQLLGQMAGEGSDVNTAGGVTPQLIEQRINEWLPKDFEANAKYYQYVSMGYTKAQAKDLQDFDRYSKGQMPAAEKAVYDIANPTWAAKADEIKMSQGLMEDIGMKKDEQTGETVPKYGTFEELRQKYPNVQEATLKEMVKPVEQQSLTDDVRQWYDPRMQSGVKELLETPVEKGGGYNGVTGSNNYKELKTKLNFDEELPF